MQFVPTDLGVALYQGFKRLAEVSGVDLSLPDLRARMESDMALVARGQKTKAEVLRVHLAEMRQVLLLLKFHVRLLDGEMLSRLGAIGSNVSRDGVTLVANFSECGKCSSLMDLKATGVTTGSGRRGRRQGSGGRHPTTAELTGRLTNRFLVCTRFFQGCQTVLLLPPRGELAPHSVRYSALRTQGRKKPTRSVPSASRIHLRKKRVHRGTQDYDALHVGIRHVLLQGERGNSDFSGALLYDLPMPYGPTKKCPALTSTVWRPTALCPWASSGCKA
ncbi:dna topoisomerase iii [Cystoisospora suis]|uniref:DNA topoisomerase n=1 Tax=Cystoisospora suis TaxID=483139 RepID=A0A2C6KH80_9APIC|nr:dna topoisomerase iii [Cystoisospora suis]